MEILGDDRLPGRGAVLRVPPVRLVVGGDGGAAVTSLSEGLAQDRAGGQARMRLVASA